jgi:hypothetical protein
MAEQTRIAKYIAGAIIGALVFVATPEMARWLHGGAFAQGVQQPFPPVSGNCNFFGNSNVGCNTFNYGVGAKPARELADVDKTMLLGLPKGAPINVSTAYGANQEAFNFAAKVASFLRSNGYQTREGDTVIQTGPHGPAEIQDIKNGDAITKQIVIGNNN